MASEQQDASKDVHVSELKKAFEPEDSEEIVEEKKSEGEGEGESVPGGIERSDRSFKEESNFFSDLRGYEKRALTELQKKLEAAILGNKLFKVRKIKVEETKKSSEKQVENDEKVKESEENDESATNEEKQQQEEPTNEKVKESEIVRDEGEEEKGNEIVEEKVSEVDEEISLWGVKLLPSKGEEDTNVLLLKFLRARDFDVNEAFVTDSIHARHA